MKRFRYIFRILAVLFLLALCAALFSACASKSDIDTGGMYLVIYDGNGGYLGNKAAQVRKLYCTPGSKIPDYPVDYVENQYTVSSLGLAMREGYQLLGWYASADYREDPSGDYIFLSPEEGNGVYEEKADGKYVRNFVTDENGEYIFVYVEPSPETEEGSVSYIFIPPQEEDIGVEPGFYVCGGQADIDDIDSDEIREAYREAFARGVYSQSHAESRGGWQLIDDFGEEDRELFSGLTRYRYTFTEATEDDAALDHYDLVSGYASLNGIFTENEKGGYVFRSGNYEKRKDGEEDAGDRYSVNDKYVFSAGSTEGFLRFAATLDYWDFANDTVDEGDCTWDGEKYVLTLYAHWEKKNTVFYHYNNGTGKVDEATKKLLADNITYVPLTAGETIGKKEIVPGYVDHTFLCWSKEDGAYAPWDFANDVFPEGENELHLYAYYIEGTYTRINSVKSLADVGKDPSGKYLLTEDVRLPGTGYTSSPLGLTEETLFTGEFLAFGHKITGLTFNLVPSKKYAGSSDVLSAFLFPVVSGGKIEGLSVEAEYVISGLSSRDEPLFREDIRIACSGLVGEVLPSLGGTGERTRIKDCSVALTVRPKSSSALQSSAYRYLIDVADLVWSGAEASFAVSGCSSGVDSSALTGSVSVSAKKLAG